MKTLLILSFFLTGIPQIKNYQMATNQNQEKNKAVTRKLYEEILNTGKFELLAGIISQNYEGPRGIKGPEGFSIAIRPVRAAFPDIHWTIEDLIAENEKIVVMWSWTGTNTVSFDGFPVSNARVTHHAISIFQFSDGKIIKGWMQADRLGFYEQIGVISPDLVKPRVK